MSRGMLFFVRIDRGLMLREYTKIEVAVKVTVCFSLNLCLIYHRRRDGSVVGELCPIVAAHSEPEKLLLPL